MTCSRCAEREAAVVVKQILNRKVTERRLCAECAANEGLLPAEASPSLSLLFSAAAGARAAAPARAACPVCSTRYAQFREDGMLGCSDCYAAFAGALAPLLERVHGAARHRGKAPGGEPAARLKGLLEAAVRAEDYETASRLRDRLKRLGG